MEICFLSPNFGDYMKYLCFPKKHYNKDTTKAVLGDPYKIFSYDGTHTELREKVHVIVPDNVQRLNGLQNGKYLTEDATLTEYKKLIKWMNFRDLSIKKGHKGEITEVEVRALLSGKDKPH